MFNSIFCLSKNSYNIILVIALATRCRNYAEAGKLGNDSKKIPPRISEVFYKKIIEIIVLTLRHGSREAHL